MSVINTNVNSLVAQNAVNANSRNLSAAMQQLSTGKRINGAKDDAAGLSISQIMTSQIRGLNMAVRNANDGISLLQTADGAMIEQSNMMQRMRELSVQAASDTVTTSQKGYLQNEFSALRTEINRIGANTKWNERNLLDGTGGVAQVDQATGGLVGFGPTAPLVNTYGDHPITADFGNNNSFYPFSRAIVLTSVEGIQSTELLSTNEQSWAEKNIEQDLVFNPEEDLKGPLTLGAALTRPLENQPSESSAPDSTPPKESRLVVIGNSTFATNGLFSQQLNGDVLTNSVLWLSQREGEVLSINPKDPTNRRIQLQTVQARWVVWLSLIIMPLVGFGLGGFIWWKRR